jgi:cytochrome c oxidase subunit 4
MAKSPLHAGESHGHEIHPTSMYLKTAFVLALFMGITIWASFISFPGGVVVNNLIAIGIATFKVGVVVLYFMHVKWASNLGKLWAFIGFFFVLTLGVIYLDYFWRSHEHVNGWIKEYPETALPRQIGTMDAHPLDPSKSNIQNRNAVGGM